MRTLEYTGFTYQYPIVSYSFLWQGKEYSRRVDLGNLSRVEAETCDARLRERLMSHVGLTMAREFFRAERVERIIVRPPHFFEESASFFETWFRAGLAELRYVNEIPLDEPVEFVIDQPQKPDPMECADDGLLLCNGGGKDSAVAAEALKHAEVPFTWLSLTPNPSMERIQQLSGAPELHVRTGLGRAALKSSKRFKGHMPFMPLVAATGTLVAHLQGFSSVAVGNEYSANFGNLEQSGVAVNHQYGKSLDFENLFRGYLQRNLTGISYFSVLQPFYELQVVKALARFPQYFEAFKSCNVSRRQNGWCRRCPKCAFIYLCLAAFLDREAILGIFDGDPWEEERTQRTLRNIISATRKPFECIGTFEEAQEAARLMLVNSRGPAINPQVASAITRWLPAEADDRTSILFGHRMRPHNIPFAIWPKIAEFFETGEQPAVVARKLRTAASDAVLILSSSRQRSTFELDMAGRLLLQALDRSGVRWTLHSPWLPLPPASNFLGVLTWSFRYDENNFVYWARKAEAFYRSAGLCILNSVDSFSIQHSWNLRRWSADGIRCAQFEKFSDVDSVTLSYPMILRSDGLHKGRNTFLVHNHAEARKAIGQSLEEGVSLDLAIEFLDLQFPDGYYRNRFAFVAGDRVIPRQHAIGQNWLLNFETAEASAKSVREDREFRALGEERSDLVVRAARATGAEIVGIDYGISPSGEYVFWEAHRHFRMTGDAGYRTAKLEAATGRSLSERAVDDQELGNAMAVLVRSKLFPMAAVA